MELTTTATDWAAMRFDARKGAIGERWYSFQRRTLADAWDIGRGLRSVKDEMQHGEFRPYLAEIAMNRETARRFMALAETYEMTQLVSFASVDDALKALPPARPKEEPKAAPAPEPAEPADPPAEAVTGDVIDGVDPAAEAAMNEAAAEAEIDPVQIREDRLERLAIRTDDIDGDVVEGWAHKQDAADVRHRDDVSAVNEARKTAASDRRELRDVRDALLVVPRGDGDAGIDDVLAKFFGVARK